MITPNQPRRRRGYTPPKYTEKYNRLIPCRKCGETFMRTRDRNHYCLDCYPSPKGGGLGKRGTLDVVEFMKVAGFRWRLGMSPDTGR